MEEKDIIASPGFIHIAFRVYMADTILPTEVLSFLSFSFFFAGGLTGWSMLTLNPGSSCDVCAEEYGPHCLPHSIPCGKQDFYPCFYFFFTFFLINYFYSIHLYAEV